MQCTNFKATLKIYVSCPAGGQICGQSGSRFFGGGGGVSEKKSLKKGGLMPPSADLELGRP